MVRQEISHEQAVGGEGDHGECTAIKRVEELSALRAVSQDDNRHWWCALLNLYFITNNSGCEIATPGISREAAQPVWGG